MTAQSRAITAIRMLAADSVQKANSGHPGMPIGSAPMAYAIWKQMKHNPKDPAWQARDRFVLSAGHASMLEYALLHLFGYPLGIEDLKAFRQWGSKTPGIRNTAIPSAWKLPPAPWARASPWRWAWPWRKAIWLPSSTGKAIRW